MWKGWVRYKKNVGLEIPSKIVENKKHLILKIHPTFHGSTWYKYRRISEMSFTLYDENLLTREYSSKLLKSLVVKIQHILI